jgi:starch synthase
MRKGLFVLNQDLSGINRFMFRGLSELGWHVRVESVALPRPRQLLLAGTSFRPQPARWRRRYHQGLAAFAKSDKGMAQRTELCSTLLRKADPEDVLLTFGTLFVPRFLDWKRPYAVFKDYTVALAARARESGLPREPAEIERYMQLEAEMCRSAGVVLVASENTKRSVVEDYGAADDKVVVTGEGLCFEEFPPPPVDRPDRREILFVGKDFERKGGEVLLEAFRSVQQQVPGARLTVLGPARREIELDGLDWVGLVSDRNRVAAYFQRSSVFAMPSFCEPFGLVFLEAMAHGLPCVGAARDAMPEIIEDGVTGFLVGVGDVRALADRIVFLLQRPDESRAMGRRGYERVRSRFQWSHVAARMDTALLALR